MTLTPIKQKYNFWADVHNTNSYTHEYYNLSKEFYTNSFLKDNTIYLLHSTTTSNYNKILKQQNLYPSAGCLVGGIYSTPLYKDDIGLRVHNLGSYYSIKEIPKVIEQRVLNDENVINLIIEIRGCNISKYSGINYLKMGGIHYHFFNNYKYLAGNDTALEILNQVNNILTICKSFLLRTCKLFNKKLGLNESIQYLNEFGIQSHNLLILPYVFFEALSDYIILNQNDDISNIYKQKNEVYNWNYKNIMFELYPFLLTRFNLEDINFNLSEIINKLKESNIFNNFDSNNFTIKLCSKILKIINQNFLSEVYENDFEGLSNRLNSTISYNLIPLAGHIIHKIMKSKEYSKLYSLIQQEKANDIWKYWYENDILIISNDLIPKGEVGINPYLVKNYIYNIYTCDKLVEKNNFYYIDKYSHTDIKIEPQLIKYHDSLLR